MNVILDICVWQVLQNLMEMTEQISSNVEQENIVPKEQLQN